MPLAFLAVGERLAYNPRAAEGAVYPGESQVRLRVMSGWFRSRWQVLPTPVRIVGLQTAVLLAIASVLVWFAGSQQSFLIGGTCAVLPNAWMAWRMRHRPGRDPAGEALRALLGAFEKLALTSGLLALALLRLNDLSAPAFFAGFIVALAAHHAALVIVTREGREA